MSMLFMTVRATNGGMIAGVVPGSLTLDYVHGSSRSLFASLRFSCFCRRRKLRSSWETWGTEKVSRGFLGLEIEGAADTIDACFTRMFNVSARSSTQSLNVMATFLASIHDQEPAVAVTSVEELEDALEKASNEASLLGRLNIVVLTAPSLDCLSIVVGGEETVLNFNYGHGDPPYYASIGEAQLDGPVLTAFVGLAHHTEFPRRWVVPTAEGRRAAREFLETGARPKALRWVEV